MDPWTTLLFTMHPSDKGTLTTKKRSQVGLSADLMDPRDDNIRYTHDRSLTQSALDEIRYDTRCYFNVRSKADMSQLNLLHGTDTKKCKTEKLKSKNRYAQKSQ